jgi:hypothetical protein
MKGATGGVSDVSGIRYKFAPTEGTVFVRTKAGTEVVITHSNPTMSTQVQPQPPRCRVDIKKHFVINKGSDIVIYLG